MDSKAARLTGYALTGAFTLFMLFDVAIKLIRHPMVEETMRQLGFPGGLGFSVGVIEAICAMPIPCSALCCSGAIWGCSCGADCGCALPTCAACFRCAIWRYEHLHR